MARMNRSEGREGRRDTRERTDATMLKRRSLDGVKAIDCRDYELLSRFVTEFGKILPARLTGATPKQQRRIKHAVRRARNIGVMA